MKIMKKTTKSMPLLCVGDVCKLRAPLSVGADTPLTFLVSAMNVTKVDAAAVVDDQSCCVGFVTCDDVLDHISDESMSKDSTYVGDIMRPPNMVAYLDDPVEHALILMSSYNLDWLPVVDPETRHFSGLICREDFGITPVQPISFGTLKCPDNFMAANAA